MQNAGFDPELSSTYPAQIAQLVEKLTPVFSKAAIGDFSENVDFSEADEELVEIYAGVQLLIETAREQLEELSQKNKDLERIAKALEEAQRISRVGNWERDLVANTFMASDQLFLLFGLSGQTFPGTFEAFLETIHPDDRPKMVKQLEGVGKADHSWEFEHRIILSDGSVRWMRSKGVILVDSENRPMKMIGTEQDITEQHEIDRAKTEFISIASHQLRTPLTSMRWSTEMLLSDTSKYSEEHKKFLDIIYQSILRMIDLVRSLMNVSRLQMGEIEVKPEKLDFAELLEVVIRDLSLPAVKRKVEIVLTAPDRPYTLEVDPEIVKVVLQNVILNAIHYSKEGGKVEVTVVDRLDGMLCTVVDHGIGIPSGEQSKIFTKFFRAENARRQLPEGTGIGLYLVKLILDRIGGKIWFESKEDEGTTFYLLFSKQWKVLPVVTQ